MERLKAILADKILDLSTSSGDEVKVKIEKIQRFRDFANACKTLMVKYPDIEDELIKMVEDENYDTKVASSRVDTVIRLSDTNNNSSTTIQSSNVEPSVSVNDTSTKPEQNTIKEEQEEIPATIENTTPTDESSHSDSKEFSEIDDIPMEVYQGEDEPIYNPEDVDYEEIIPSSEEDKEKGYVSFENISSEDENRETTKSTTNNNKQEENNISSNEDELAKTKRKVTIKRIVQAIGAIVIIVALIFIVKFVLVHWQTILIIVGALAVIAILFFWIKRKRK